MEKSLKQQQQPARMMKKRQEHKSGKVDRRKSLRSVGSFMSRVLKTLGTLAHLGEADGAEAEDDDGGFRKSGGGGGSGGVPSGKQPGEPPPAHGVRQSLSGSGSVKERLSWCYGERTPGVLGLKNHGNTCFMNAVVQCLSNTDLLAEYLGLEQYRANGLAQPRRGEVTEQLATLVRGLWTLEYTPQLSVEFKSIVSKYGAQFRGNSQHDALEFLLWLLDRMHEDVSPSPSSLSSKTKAPGKGTSGTEGTSNTHPQQPGGRHSFVQDHFQAQYRSSLTCPHCFKQSNTFDPFLCISLPIPLRQTRPIFITLVFSTKGQRYLRVGLAVPLFGTVAILRDMVADEGKISPEQVILTEVYSAGFQRSFFDDEDLTNIAESDVIYAFQAPPLYGRGGSMRNSGYHHSLPSSPYFSGPEGQRMSDSGTLSSEFLNHGGSSKILLLICNTSGPAQQVARFGPPFLMREDRTISWDQLQQSILSKLYYLMIDRAQTQSMERVPFKIRVVGGSTSYSYLSPQDGRPLCHPAVDRALKFCAAGGPPHVKLHVEWEPKIKDSLFGNIQEEVVKDAESVRTQQQQHLQQHSCTLDECFQLYTKEEQLAPDDAWKCPHCKQLQQGMVKMSLWTLPDILILHLKRFRQVGERRNKLSTLVRFPLASLDMAPHVVKRSQSSRSLGPWSAGWKQPYPPDTGPPPEFLYDLYAVCNHHGGMHGGHYTAYCRNSVDGQWYSYDDSSVDLTPEEEICTRGAYILFYQRRNVIPPWSASSSVRGSTSSSASDHWLLRLAGDSKRGSMVSRASTNCPSSLPESPGIPESPVFSEEPLKEERGGFESRPFVRGIQGRSVSMRTPTKTRESLAKVLPLRWSFGSRERHKRPPGELVEYLESGRRPRCTKDPIAALMEKEPSTTRRQEAFTSPSLGGLSCLGRVSDEQLDCDRVPQGQQRPGLEKTRRGSSKSKQEQGKSQESQSHRNSSVGNPNLESTLKRGKGASGGQGDHASQPEESKVKKPLELGGPEGLLAFLKSSFMKKDSQKKPRESVTLQEGISPRQDSSRLSLNGAAEAKVNGAPRSKRSEKPLANGRVQRSQSSSNLPNRSDGTLRRSTSLHKNGTPGPPRSLTAEKPSSASLQRSRYSTASLGRKRTVPESSF